MTLPPESSITKRQILKASPAGLAWAYTGGKYDLPPHLDLLNRYLLQVALGNIRLLIVTMPPRHGKSELISKYFPAWYVQYFKDKRIILSSYEANFAAWWGGQARDVAAATCQYFNVSLRRTANAFWSLSNHSGMMQTAGVGGAITGKGADIFIIDDPVKNEKESFSDVQRQHAWDWYLSTASTRLEPNGSIIIVMTRWHEDDLAGRVLSQAKEIGLDATILNFPAICEDESLPLERAIGRKNGQALWGERFNEEQLDLIRQTKGPYWWNALYQQHPAPLEGNFVKKAWFRYFEMQTVGNRQFLILHKPDGDVRVAIEDCRIFATVDLAASTKTTADYTVLSIWAYVLKTGEMCWLDAHAERMEGPDQPDLIKKMNATYKPLMIGVESNAYQLTLVQTLQRDGLPIMKLLADSDKVSRFIPMANQYRNGLVYHRLHAEWLLDAEPQLLLFPNATHDDFVDTASYAYKMLPLLVGAHEVPMTGY